MTEFKVGDKVRILADGWGFQEGHVRAVEKGVLPIRVDVDNSPLNTRFNEDELELIEEEK